MQAIVTRYHGPGNVKGSRVKATAKAGTVTLEWNDTLNEEQNHAAAAQALVAKLGTGWRGHWVAGRLPDGSVAWVNADSKREVAP